MQFSRILTAFCLAWPVGVYAQMGSAPMPDMGTAVKKEPTLEETQNWILKALPELGYEGYDDKNRETRRSIVFSGCDYSILYISFKTAQIETVQPSRWMDNKPIAYVKLEYGNLSSLFDFGNNETLRTVGNADSISVINSYRIYMYGTPVYKAMHGDRLAIASISDELKKMPEIEGESDRYELNHMSITEVRSQDLYKRVLNAFAHAGKLCRTEDAAKRQEAQAKAAKRPDEPF